MVSVGSVLAAIAMPPAVYLLDGEPRAGVLDAWSKDADDVRDVLKAIALVRSAPQRSRDVVAGYGEIWSAR